MTEQHIDPHELVMVNASLYLRRPLVLAGNPGVGKSALAYRIARELWLGRVLKWSISTHTTLTSGLYRYGAIGRLQAAATGQQQSGPVEDPPIGDFIRLGPLGAFLPRILPGVLLIDELDKSESDLPNNLLSIPEDGESVIDEPTRIRHSAREMTVHTADPNETAIVTDGRVRGYAFPIVIMTSNGEREFPPAFLRRALQLEIKDSNVEQLAAMVANHLLNPDGLHRDTLVREFVEKSRTEGGIPAHRLLDAIYLAASGGCNPKREVRSWHDDAIVLDEQRTAGPMAQPGGWRPVTRPRTERWLDLTLVVDRSALMTPWQSQIAAFTEILSRLGAFRTIQIRLVKVVVNPDGSAIPMLRGSSTETPAQDPPRSWTRPADGPSCCRLTAWATPGGLTFCCRCGRCGAARCR